MKNRKTILHISNWVIIPVIVIIGVCLSYLSLFLFTKLSIYNNTGSIGDTIGGLTAPVFNLIAAILIFISFKEQYKANQLQKETISHEVIRTNSINEYNQIIDLISEIKDELRSLEFYHSSMPGFTNGEKYTGLLTISNLDKTVIDIEKGMFNEKFWDALIITLSLVNFTINKIDLYTYRKEDQQVLKVKLYNFLKNPSNDIYTYSFLLQKANLASKKHIHFYLFVSFEKTISEFIKTTHKDVLNNTVSSPTKLNFSIAQN